MGCLDASNMTLYGMKELSRRLLVFRIMKRPFWYFLFVFQGNKAEFMRIYDIHFTKHFPQQCPVTDI